MKLYVGNAFSLSMLDRDVQRGQAGDSLYPPRIPRPVIGSPLLFCDAYEDSGIEIESVIGHADTAALFGAILGRTLPMNRVSLKLGADDRLLVGQYAGPRLPEGCTTLPVGASIEWWIV